MSSSDSKDSSFFASTFFSCSGAAEVEGAGPPAVADAPAPGLQLRLQMLMLTRAFTTSPGQKGLHWLR